MESIGFKIVYKNRSKISRFKSGGILVAIRKNVCVRWKLIRFDSDSILSVKVDKRSVGLDKELILSCVYIPPSHSRYGNEEHFGELDNFLLTYTNEDYEHVLCGGFNAHTLTFPDYYFTVSDDNLTTAEVNYNNLTDYDIPVDRANQDMTPDRNSYGRKLVDICKNNQVFIFNGRLGEDSGVGRHTTTYHTTIDYFLGSPSLMQLVENFKVLDFDPLLSDVHCGLHTQFSFIVGKVMKETCDHHIVSERVKPGKWKTEKKNVSILMKLLKTKLMN